MAAKPVRLLLASKWPLVPSALALLVLLSPVYLVYLPIHGHTGRIPIEALWDFIVALHFLPALAYYAALSPLRRRVKAWWLMPVRPAGIGRAVWWQLIGIPALILLAGTIANIAITVPLIHNDGYADMAGHQYAVLMILVVNWGGWTMLRYGRFRYRQMSGASSLFKHTGTIWPTVGAAMAILSLVELGMMGEPGSHWPNSAPAASGLLLATAGVLYVFPNIAVWLNSLLEEKAGSWPSRFIGAIVPVGWTLVVLFGLAVLVYQLGEWAVQLWSGSLAPSFAAAGHAVSRVAVVGIVSVYGFMIATNAYSILRERSPTATSGLNSFFEKLPLPGWLGLVNIAPLFFWTAVFVPVLFVWRWSGLDLGLLVAFFAALSSVVGIRCNRRVLASLPVEAGDVTVKLQMMTLAVAALPLGAALIASVAAGSPPRDLRLAFAFWLLGAAFGQLWPAYRMNPRGIPLPMRWIAYGAVAVWGVLAIHQAWPQPFGLLAPVMGGLTARGGDFTNLLTTAAQVLPACAAAALAISLMAWSRVYRDLTRNAGGRVVP